MHPRFLFPSLLLARSLGRGLAPTLALALPIPLAYALPAPGGQVAGGEQAAGEVAGGAAQAEPVPAARLAATRARLIELCAEPRTTSTAGARRAAELVGRALREAGWAVAIEEESLELLLPRESQLAFFPDDAQGLPERLRAWSFDPDGRPGARPRAFVLGSAAGHARGPLVQPESSAADALERLRATGLDFHGCVLLCDDARPDDLLRWASEAGCAGVLFYPAQPARLAPEDQAAGDDDAPGPPYVRLSQASPLVCQPIARARAEQIREQLRARRMQGADGGRRGYRIGPGPLEAELSIEGVREPRLLRSTIARLDSEPVSGQSNSDSGSASSAPDAPRPLLRASCRLDAFGDEADAARALLILLRAAERIGAAPRAGWSARSELQLEFRDTGAGCADATAHAPAALPSASAPACCAGLDAPDDLVHLLRAHPDCALRIEQQAEALAHELMRAAERGEDTLEGARAAAEERP